MTVDELIARLMDVCKELELDASTAMVEIDMNEWDDGDITDVRWDDDNSCIVIESDYIRRRNAIHSEVT